MALRDIISSIIHSKQTPMKTEGGIQFPAEDFAYVPDAEKASTWKLRMSEGRPGNITRAQLGRAAAAFSPGGFRGQRVQIPSGDVASVKSKIRAAYRKIGVADKDIPPALKERSFMLCKDGDDLRWFAVYSNNYRDDDGVPEILSEAAHKDFERAVDAGEWPMPELWAWHVPGSRWGAADLVAYDDSTGFVLSTGLVDKGKEHVAELVAERDDLLVSHGMPRSEILRDPGDDSVLTRYRTQEISVLPHDKAANKHTQFRVLKEETDMTIRQDKKDFLAEIGLDPAEIEAVLEAKKAQVQAEGRESKEVEPEQAAPEPVAPEPAAPAITADVIAQAMGAAITQAMEPVLTRLEALEQKAKDADNPDPFEAIMTSYKSRVIGSDETRVDGRTKEAKDAPVETPAMDGFAPPVKVQSGSIMANSVNRIFGNVTAKELMVQQ